MKLYKIYIFIIFIFIGACVFSTVSAIKIDYLNKTSSLQPPPLDATSNVSGNKNTGFDQVKPGPNLLNPDFLPTDDKSNADKVGFKNALNKGGLIWWIVVFVAVFFVAIVVLYKVKKKRVSDKNG